METEPQIQGTPSGETVDRSKHLDIMCLGIITIATAAIGAALLGSNLDEIVTSVPRYSLAIIGLLTYLTVLYSGFAAIFSAASDSQASGGRCPRFVLELFAKIGPKQDRVATVFRWFVIEMLSLVGLLGVVEAYESLLRSLSC